MNGSRYHLAWLKLNTDLFLTGKATSEEIQYALVPADLPERGQWDLDRVSPVGRPLGTFPAVPEYLRTLRRPGFAAGTEDPLEQRLIEHLKGRALNAGHVLPGIVPTLRLPKWSKLVLPAFVILELQRRGGAGV